MKNKSSEKEQFKFKLKVNHELEILQTIERKIKQSYCVVFVIDNDQDLDNLKIVNENQSTFIIKIKFINIEKWKIYINLHFIMQIMKTIHFLKKNEQMKSKMLHKINVCLKQDCVLRIVDNLIIWIEVVQKINTMKNWRIDKIYINNLNK